jgi:hypothetical protein
MNVLHASDGRLSVLIKALALLFVVSVVMLSSDAIAKRKPTKEPAENVSQQERCCHEIGALWKPELRTCLDAGGFSNRQGGSTREQIYDACIARRK